jgi:glycosyltransferase involved in cell wall biosynthesis
MIIKKKIFFVTSLNSGGIENYLLRFLTHFDGKIEPIIICKGNQFGELEEEYRKISYIRLIKMDVGHFTIKSYRNIYNFLRDNSIESVCDFTGDFAGITMLIARLSKIKIRVTFYRNAAIKFERTFFKTIYNLFMRKLVYTFSTKILSNSESALIYFYPKKYKKDLRFKVIYNGIDADKFTNINSYKKNDFGIKSTNFVIGHTGRFDSQKNHKTIIQVAEILLEKYVDISFILCGKNTDIHLPKLIKDRWRDRIKILGYRNDVSRIIPVFDLFFFPSIVEGQPNSLIEAMISNLPIVASNIGPIKETTPEILHKELIPPFNVDDFCVRIEEYYLSKEKREQNNFSDWAKERFDPDILFNEFYKEL